MDDDSELLSVAWRAAAGDLGIRIEAPFVAADASGDSIPFDALVCDFGWKNGTLITSLDESPRQRQLASDSHYGLCSLSREHYAQYVRAEWITLMQGWIWIGNGPAPSWHRGRGWVADAASVEIVRVELARIFGREIRPEGSIPHLILPFLAREELAAFLRSVPTGTGQAAFGRWASDVRDRQVPS